MADSELDDDSSVEDELWTCAENSSWAGDELSIARNSSDEEEVSNDDINGRSARLVKIFIFTVHFFIDNPAGTLYF